MAKVITFSRQFPAKHPKVGEPTDFVGKILNSLSDKSNYYPCACNNCGYMAMSSLFYVQRYDDDSDIYCPMCRSTDISDIESLADEYYIGKYEPKRHTIRAGNRWKVGDSFSPRVWSGKPYQSKMITIAPDIKIKKIWTFEIKRLDQRDIGFRIGGGLWLRLCTQNMTLQDLALNDGLTTAELILWFSIHPKTKDTEFTGQILCWSDDIEY